MRWTRAVVLPWLMGGAACGVAIIGATDHDPGALLEAGAPTVLPPKADEDSEAPEVTPPTPIDDDAGSDPEPIVDASVDQTADAPSAEYTLSTSNGTFVVNDGGTAPCSGSGAAAKITFRNDGTTSYRKKWVQANCAEADYGV